MNVVEEDDAVLAGVDKVARVGSFELGEGRGSHERVTTGDRARPARAPTLAVIPVRVDAVAAVGVPDRTGLPPQSETREILGPYLAKVQRVYSFLN